MNSAPTTPEMVETVARAIYDCHQFKRPWEEADAWHDLCLKEAAVATAAHTQALYDAGYEIRRPNAETTQETT